MQGWYWKSLAVFLVALGMFDVLVAQPFFPEWYSLDTAGIALILGVFVWVMSRLADR